MAYKRIIIMDIYEIIRRWHDQQSISHIAIALNNDRKTVRKYIAIAKALGLSRDLPLPAKDMVLDLLQPDDTQKQSSSSRPGDVRAIFTRDYCSGQ